MGKSKYKFDLEHFSITKVNRTLWGMLWVVLKWFIATASLAVFYYIILSLFISTPQEKQLIKENRMYAKQYNNVIQQQKLNAQVIKGLQYKDNQIYEQIFHTPAPSVDPINTIDYNFDIDSVGKSGVFKFIIHKANELKSTANSVDNNFKQIFSYFAKQQNDIPPLTSPLKNLDYVQIGASIGQKINPFYKVPTLHTGVDLLAGQGTPVYASADGQVTEVKRLKKAEGNFVEITHKGGYVTKYCHLSDIFVKKGQYVKCGTEIAIVGITGNSFAPHLHYEVWHNGVMQNPVNYLFASLSARDYANALYMANSTEQSLD